VRALGIEDYFEQIVYTEQLGREFWKPSPVGFEKLIEELGGKSENMAYIGDNEAKDFIAPNALGFVTIRITRTHGIHTEPAAGPDAEARHSIEQIGELGALLERL
jgi:putative hydrolase of the HAD superfamily